MGDGPGNHGERQDYYLDVPYGPRTGVTMDNVHHVEAPSGLVASSSEAGVRTEWDASTLDAAIEWLTTHADYLRRLSYEMVDIQELMGGPSAGAMVGGPVPADAKSPLGSFRWAQELAGKHKSLYDQTELNVRTLSDNLYAAADALRKVKENYETAEGANAMTADEMARIFADVSRGDQV